MATTGATLITALALRLRDSGNTAHARALLTRVLSHSQRAINLAERVRKQTTAMFTLTPGRTLYRTTEIAGDVARLDRIRALDRTLPHVAWRDLLNNDALWYRRTGAQPRMWARVGGNLWVLTPAPLTDVDVEIVYTITPADVIDDTTAVDVPDEWLPMVMDLAEALVLLRTRLFEQMDGPMGRLSTMLQIRPPHASRTMPGVDT